MLLLVPWLGYAAETPTPAAKKNEAKESRGGSAAPAHITETIRAQLPTFKPSPPPAADAGAAATSDVPIILARVVVTEKKAPGMEEFQILTKAGQAAYLQKQFPGAVVPGKDPLDESTPNYAAQMLRDRRRLEARSRLGEAVETFRATGDLAGSARLKDEMQRALLRRYDWRDERLDRAYNNDRR